jgi:anti-sigma factor RsiW
MVEGKGKPEEDLRPGAGPHEEFLELCAVATSGNLTEEEKKKLSEHLATCAECQKAAKEFQSVVDNAIPALAEELAPELTREDRKEDSSFNQEAAEASFLRRLSKEKKRSPEASGEADGWLSPLVVRRSRNFRGSLERFDFWLPLAAAGLLCLALGILTYRMGKHRGVDVARREQASAIPRAGVSQETLAAVVQERDAANARLSEQNTAISALKREMTRQLSENAKLKTLQSDQEVALENSAGEKRQLSAERDRLAQELAAGQVSLQTTEDKLRKLEKERSESVIHTASLEAQVADLSRVVTEQQKDIGKEKELLAKDKDIRELMGARKLYVAEVLDIGQTGETQKAFGRIFYTEGKSLIFYAFDIDERPGWKNANSIQAWGMRGPDRQQALNLGLFYEDNAAKKRWVLKFNDGKTLSQIDAVFVTLEPQGGSQKPSRKPFLFAYLKMDPNHP